MAKNQSNYPGSLDVLDTDRQAGQLVTSDSYDIIEDAITEIEAELRRVTAKSFSNTNKQLRSIRMPGLSLRH